MSQRKTEETLDSESSFYNIIETDKTICSNCYRKIKVVLSSEEWASENLPDSTLDTLADRSYFEEHTAGSWVQGEGPVPDSPQHSFSVYCDCGSEWGDSKIRPISKRKTLDYAENIVARLKEAGVDFSAPDFLDEVKWRKQDPDYQFNEELIFEEALEETIDE